MTMMMTNYGDPAGGGTKGTKQAPTKHETINGAVKHKTKKKFLHNLGEGRCLHLENEKKEDEHNFKQRDLRGLELHVHGIHVHGLHGLHGLNVQELHVQELHVHGLHVHGLQVHDL
jgi:hypothetical protein